MILLINWKSIGKRNFLASSSRYLCFRISNDHNWPGRTRSGNSRPLFSFILSYQLTGLISSGFPAVPIFYPSQQRCLHAKFWHVADSYQSMRLGQISLHNIAHIMVYYAVTMWESFRLRVVPNRRQSGHLSRSTLTGDMSQVFADRAWLSAASVRRSRLITAQTWSL